MAISDLLLFSGLALFCGWSWPELRLLSFFLLLAAGATLFTNHLDAIDRAFFFMPFDIVTGAVAILIWHHSRSAPALLFGLGSMGMLMCHFAMFQSPHTPLQRDFYAGALNVLFLAQCAITGGIGFARHHRDTLGRGRVADFKGSARRGGE